MLSVGPSRSSGVESTPTEPESSIRIGPSRRAVDEAATVTPWEQGRESANGPRTEAPREHAATDAQRACGYASADPETWRSQRTAYDRAAQERERSVEAMKHAGTLARAFVLLDALGGMPDGLIGLPELQRAASDPNLSPEIRAAAQYYLTHPDELARLDTAAGVGGADRTFGLRDFEARIHQLNQELQRPLPACPPAPPPGPEAPPLADHGWVPPPWLGRPDHLGPELQEYRSVLRTLTTHFATVDAASGARNGGITREDLEAIIDNPNANPRLQRAAEFLLDHPEYLHRLDGAHFGGDGRITREGLRRELAEVDGELRRLADSVPEQRCAELLAGARELCEPGDPYQTALRAGRG